MAPRLRLRSFRIAVHGKCMVCDPDIAPCHSPEGRNAVSPSVVICTPKGSKQHICFYKSSVSCGVCLGWSKSKVGDAGDPARRLCVVQVGSTAVLNDGFQGEGDVSSFGFSVTFAPVWPLWHLPPFLLSYHDVTRVHVTSHACASAKARLWAPGRSDDGWTLKAFRVPATLPQLSFPSGPLSPTASSRKPLLRCPSWPLSKRGVLIEDSFSSSVLWP